MSGGGGPSRRAVEAVLATYTTPPLDSPEANLATMRERLAAAHDQALGLDRSVCLREVIEALRGDKSPIAAPDPLAPQLWAAADWLEHRG